MKYHVFFQKFQKYFSKMRFINYTPSRQTECRLGSSRLTGRRLRDQSASQRPTADCGDVTALTAAARRPRNAEWAQSAWERPTGHPVGLGDADWAPSRPVSRRLGGLNTPRSPFLPALLFFLFLRFSFLRARAPSPSLPARFFFLPPRSVSAQLLLALLPQSLFSCCMFFGAATSCISLLLMFLRCLIITSISYFFTVFFYLIEREIEAIQDVVDQRLLFKIM